MKLRTTYLFLGLGAAVLSVPPPLFPDTIYGFDPSSLKLIPIPVAKPGGITLRVLDPFSTVATTVGTQATITLIPGFGIIPILIDTGKEITLQLAVDTAVIPAAAGTNVGDVQTWDGKKWVAGLNQGIPFFADGVRQPDGTYLCPASLPGTKVDGWGVRVYRNGLRLQTSEYTFPTPSDAAGAAVIRFNYVTADTDKVVCDFRLLPK